MVATVNYYLLLMDGGNVLWSPVKQPRSMPKAHVLSWTGNNTYRGNLATLPVAQSTSQAIESRRSNMCHNKWENRYYLKYIPSCETS